MPKLTSEEKVSTSEIPVRYRQQLLGIEGVEGIAVDEQMGTTVITVFVAKRSKALERRIPNKLGRYPVKLEVTGGFRAF